MQRVFCERSAGASGMIRNTGRANKGLVHLFRSLNPVVLIDALATVRQYPTQLILNLRKTPCVVHYLLLRLPPRCSCQV
jgi:hypothetical protein